MYDTHVDVTAYSATETTDWMSLRLEIGVPTIGGYFDFSDHQVHLTICSNREDCLARLTALHTAAAKALAEFEAPEAPKEDATNAEGN
jgi:hypothetical protein